MLSYPIRRPSAPRGSIYRRRRNTGVFTTIRPSFATSNCLRVESSCLRVFYPTTFRRASHGPSRFTSATNYKQPSRRKIPKHPGHIVQTKTSNPPSLTSDHDALLYYSSANMATPPTNTPIGLLALPGELRNRIWELAIATTETTPIAIPIFRPLPASASDTGSDSDTAIVIPSFRTTPEPPASLTCKALRHEVLSIYYTSTTFTLGFAPFGAMHSHYVHTHAHYLRAARSWRTHLAKQPPARQPRAFELGTVLRVWIDERRGYDLSFSVRAKRDREEGPMRLRLRGCGEDFCVCEYHNTPSLRAKEDLGVVGLIDAVVEVCEKLFPNVREEVCEACRGARLVLAL